MNNVCVTGGAGFVGRAFVRRLLRYGCTVTVIDDLSSGYVPDDWPKAPQLIFMKVDARNYFRYSNDCAFDTVFHLAAVVGGRLKIDGDPLAVATDLSIDAEFFNWLASSKNKPKRIVYFSSSAVYPVDLQRKGTRCNLSEFLVDFRRPRIGLPDMTYGWSKLSGEYLAQFAVEKYDLPVVIYRPFSGYGPEQAFDYPFPSIVRRVINGESPVVVWGSGDQVRDFIYIDDVVEAVLATMDQMAPGQTLNLGSGVGTSFRELAHRTAKILGREIIVTNDATKPEGVFSRVADVYKLNQFYKLQTSLDEGIGKVIAGLTNRKP